MVSARTEATPAAARRARAWRRQNGAGDTAEARVAVALDRLAQRLRGLGVGDRGRDQSCPRGQAPALPRERGVVLFTHGSASTFLDALRGRFHPAGHLGARPEQPRSDCRFLGAEQLRGLAVAEAGDVDRNQGVAERLRELGDPPAKTSRASAARSGGWPSWSAGSISSSSASGARRRAAARRELMKVLRSTRQQVAEVVVVAQPARLAQHPGDRSPARGPRRRSATPTGPMRPDRGGRRGRRACLDRASCPRPSPAESSGAPYAPSGLQLPQRSSFRSPTVKTPKKAQILPNPPRRGPAFTADPLLWRVLHSAAGNRRPSARERTASLPALVLLAILCPCREPPALGEGGCTAGQPVADQRPLPGAETKVFEPSTSTLRHGAQADSLGRQQGHRRAAPSGLGGGQVSGTRAISFPLLRTTLTLPSFGSSASVSPTTGAGNGVASSASTPDTASTVTSSVTAASSPVPPRTRSAGAVAGQQRVQAILAIGEVASRARVEEIMARSAEEAVRLFSTDEPVVTGSSVGRTSRPGRPGETVTDRLRHRRLPRRPRCRPAAHR